MAFSDIIRRMRDSILNNKLITFLSVALFAFVISTIALASQNNSNADALAQCQGQLWTATSVAPPASEATTLVPDGSTITEAPIPTPAPSTITEQTPDPKTTTPEPPAITPTTEPPETETPVPQAPLSVLNQPMAK